MNRDEARQYLQSLNSFCNDQCVDADIAQDEESLMSLVNAPKFILTTDGDGHWYVIPADKQQEFAGIVEAIGKYWEADSRYTEAPPEIPDYAKAVGGAPSLVEFTGYTIR